MNFQIRRAGPQDAPIVAELTRAAYAKWVPVIGREPLPMRADHAAAIAEHRVDLLVVGGTVAASIEMFSEPECLLIENLAVAPAFQRRGLGSLLLRHAEQTAVGLGLRAMRLYTHERFEGNVELYRRHGFSVDREEPFMGGVTVYMTKALDA